MLNKYYSLLSLCLINASLLALQQQIKKRPQPNPAPVQQVDPGIEPTTKAFIESLTGPAVYEMSPEKARAFLIKAQAGPVDAPAVDIEDRVIPTGPEGTVSIRIVRPQGDTSKLPVIMYFHGAGWVMGGKDTHDRLVKNIAHGAHAAVVFVNYTLSPEAQYPVPLEEAYAATKYVAEHGKELNLDASRLAVAGDSVGGNMATVVALLASERNGPNIMFQLLLYPVTNADFDTASYDQFATGPYLPKKAMEWFWDNYLPDQEMRKEPTASPLRASLAQLQNLPPALVITDEFDVLRDEGEAYAHKLNEAGIRVTAVRVFRYNT